MGKVSRSDSRHICAKWIRGDKRWTSLPRSRTRPSSKTSTRATGQPKEVEAQIRVTANKHDDMNNTCIRRWKMGASSGAPNSSPGQPLAKSAHLQVQAPYVLASRCHVYFPNFRRGRAFSTAVRQSSRQVGMQGQQLTLHAAWEGQGGETS